MIEFLLDEKFLMPFLSTLGASLAIIIGQQIFNFSSRQRQKLYCLNYITNIADKILFSNLLIKEKTIIPHIEATKNILKGDKELLEIMFKSDEFDILTSPSIEFNHLPQEYKLLIGFDDMKMLQAIEFLSSLIIDNSAKTNLNEFVKNNLKSELAFYSKSEKDRTDLLQIYWDYLDQIDYNVDRINGYIINVLVPSIKKYKKKRSFFFFQKKEINNNLKALIQLKKKFKSIIPDINDLKNNLDNGIQKVVK